ncbi:uncharacterized protein DDB_G0283357 isoform X2 [Wyeomyia smithii]|uniref:uncharacterized protein DDB_G0283357 isoform X2 n=1 Tax=Wyeomyia smithii TaxID=174621 RepID=UPI002467F921|nr:uncharacterized protein DDB_G0283357 isoform X2 [Wyeomyia smithii]
MNVMNNSSGDEEQVECPLCMEPLEVDDLHFYPCTCGYQICRFCWHRIRTDENELCPACRKAYPENPADFTPLSQEQIAAFKAEKRQRDQQRKAKISENRKHLANVRVVQKNLVFVVGLPPRLADPEILKKHEYFGKYGKIHKVVINPSSTYAGVQVPSASAYVTYINNNDALKAIQSVNNINMDGRLIKTSLGTTKYCSHFMKNQTCPKPDCMYLHELGDQEASFTKEEMHQGKHQEYEKRLHDTMQAQLGLTAVNGVSSGGTVMNGLNNSTGGGVGNGNGNGGNGTGTGTTTNGILANGTNGSGKTVGSNKENGSRKHEKSRTKGGRKHRGTRDSDRNRERDRDLHNKDHGGKDSHSKRNSSSSSSSNNRSSSSNHVKDSTISSGANSITNGGISSRKNVDAVAASSAFGATSTVSTTVISNGTGKSVNNGVNGHITGDEDSGKEVQNNGKVLKPMDIGCGSLATSDKPATHLDDLDDDDDELDFEDLDNDALSSDNDGKTDTPSLSSSGSSRAGGDSGSTLSETPSGKSSPTAFPDPLSVVNNVISTGNTTTAIVAVPDDAVPNSGAIVSTASTAITNGISSSSSSSISSSNFSSSSSAIASDDKSASDSTELVIEPSSPASLFGSSGNDDSGITTTMTITTSIASKQQHQQQQPPSPQNGMNKINSLIDSSTSRFAKLGIFDDNSSFFSHSSFVPYSNFNKLDGVVNSQLDGIQPSGLTSSQLPDLLSGTNDSNEQHTKEILKNLNNIQQQQQQHNLLNNVHLQQLNGLGLGNGGVENGTTEDWEAAFSKYVMRNKLDVEHHEELLRLQELQKRNIMNSGLNGASQFNGFNGDYADYFHNTNELNSRLLSQQQYAHQRLQQQQQPQHTDMNHIYAGNMSKFFDFHKNQQQQAAQHQQQQNQPFLLNGHSSLTAPDPMNIAGILENSRLSSHFLEQHSNGLLGSQHVQKQRMLNGQLNAHSILLNGANPQHQQQSQSPQQPNSRLHNPQQQPFSQQQNPVADDDLGFDPFIETQKALAELINDEISQQQMPQSATTTAPNHSKLLENVQRTRMPPPGFNHMNAFGFGVPRPHVSSSKILPFMNLTNNSQQQQQQPQQPSWGQQLQQQQQQFMGFQQNDQSHLAQSQPPSGNNKAGYGNNFPDWTSFDPAIVSFRQFSFMNGPNQPGDVFLSAQQAPNQLNQQGMQQPGQAFGHHGINLPSNLMSQPPSSNPQAQVNFSHVNGNWLNSEQNAFMSNLPTGASFGVAGFDKYSIPMPPGFQAAAAAAAVAAAVAGKQKAECIN